MKNAVSNHNASAFLRRLSAEQKGTVSTDKESDMFEIKRGTKQGDPLSSLLFNTVLQITLKDDVIRWQKTKGMGICLGDSESDCFSNLRFADDVLLFSTSLVQLQKMMCDIKQSTERVGLKIHPDKTKILSNQCSNRRKEVEIHNIKVEILSVCESANISGKQLRFSKQETAEIRNRIRAAWALFYRFRQELTAKSYFLPHRPRLFNMVITPTLS